MKQTALITAAIISGALLTPAVAQTQLPQIVEASQMQAPKTEFVKKRYTIKGQGGIVEKDGTSLLSFSNDFKTKSGPDLKVYLSPKPLSELSGKTALQSAVKIGVLKSNSGSQSYIIPEDVDLSAYQSVIIQCEAFSVLWGGFDLPVAD